VTLRSPSPEVIVIPNQLPARQSLPRAKPKGIRSMPRDKRYHVYIMASKGRVLYVGVTGFLMTRVQQHKAGETESFTQKYHVNRLVYYETFRYVNNAIARETEIKKWRREKKIALIEADNPIWEDLSSGWGQPVRMKTADSSPG
jgi:putative endonuclease